MGASRDHDQPTTSGKGTLTLAASDACANQRAALDWERDRADYSWTAVDADGCRWRVSKVIDRALKWHVVIAWSDGPYLRIGSGTYDDLEAGKEAVEWLARGSAAGVAPVIEEDASGRNPK